MKIYILGICGTFMAGIAQLARELGHEVAGCDESVYPPMSTQLEAQGIQLQKGYEPEYLDPAPDVVIVGNVIKRGNPAMEYVLNKGIPYISGAQWLSEQILQSRWVLAVAGTHGKTSTSSMLACILQEIGDIGFLIGGVPENFGVSARLGKLPFFVIEADEYDTAFFDKRSKFVHYRPRTCILNNLEFDHADIFPDLEAIERQFHHLVRTIPGEGLVVMNGQDASLKRVLAMGYWTPTQHFNDRAGWHAKKLKADGSAFEVYFADQKQSEVNWNLLGDHNVQNALAAIAAAKHVGITPDIAAEALAGFKNVKRRMEVRGIVNQVTIYDDFAHHPTAIETTLAGLRAKVGKQRIIAVVELGSYTMRSGTHQDCVEKALAAADQFVIKTLDESTDELIEQLKQDAKPGDHILIMSNRGFENIHQRLLDGLKEASI